LRLSIGTASYDTVPFTKNNSVVINIARLVGIAQCFFDGPEHVRKKIVCRRCTLQGVGVPGGTVVIAKDGISADLRYVDFFPVSFLSIDY
jgi:hypothetical protein